MSEIKITFKGKELTLEGTQLKIGDSAPDFKVIGKDLKEYSLKDFEGKTKVISVTPSLDTPVCNMQAKKFNQEASKLKDIIILNISMDLPFAINRFCLAEEIKNVQIFSDYRDASFGLSYGVLIKELRLLARAVFVLDKENKVIYKEIVPELTNELNFQAFLNFLANM